MANVLNPYSSLNNKVEQIIAGKVFYGIIQGLTFASGETTKFLLLEVPANVTVQYITQGLTLSTYDNTFNIRMTEDITTLTTGATPIIIRNMNRNYSDTPATTCSVNPVGTYGSEGIVLADFQPITRKTDFPVASKILTDNVERILRGNTKYILEFTRTTDTTSLVVEFRFIWIEN
jgi:hypothetical protein